MGQYSRVCRGGNNNGNGNCFSSAVSSRAFGETHGKLRATEEIEKMTTGRAKVKSCRNRIGARQAGGGEGNLNNPFICSNPRCITVNGYCLFKAQGTLAKHSEFCYLLPSMCQRSEGIMKMTCSGYFVTLMMLNTCSPCVPQDTFAKSVQAYAQPQTHDILQS